MYSENKSSEKREEENKKNIMKEIFFILIPVQPNLLHRNGVGPTCGFVDLDHVTHYLKFSVKINTNHLHRHFIKHKPYLKKEISKMVLEGV